MPFDYPALHTPFSQGRDGLGCSFASSDLPPMDLAGYDFGVLEGFDESELDNLVSQSLPTRVSPLLISFSAKLRLLIVLSLF